MAFPTSVNDQITDSLSQAEVTTLGGAPAASMATLYTGAAQSLAILFENAVQAQQQAAVTSQAATVQGLMQLYGELLAKPPVGL